MLCVTGLGVPGKSVGAAPHFFFLFLEGLSSGEKYFVCLANGLWNCGEVTQHRIVQKGARNQKMTGYKNNSFSNAPSRQWPVDQLYLCGKLQSHATLAVAEGSAPELMKD